jgi:hypothetical protein
VVTSGFGNGNGDYHARWQHIDRLRNGSTDLYSRGKQRVVKIGRPRRISYAGKSSVCFEVDRTLTEGSGPSFWQNLGREVDQYAFRAIGIVFVFKRASSPTLKVFTRWSETMAESHNHLQKCVTSAHRLVVNENRFQWCGSRDTSLTARFNFSAEAHRVDPPKPCHLVIRSFLHFCG